MGSPRLVFLLSVLVFACVVSAVVPRPREVPRTLLEDVAPLPAGWTRLNTLAQSQPRDLEVIFMLKNRNADLLKQTLYAVSDPRSPRYGKHLTLDQIADMTAPPRQVINDVIFFLKAQGINNVQLTKSRDILVARMSTLEASRIFQIKYAHYRHTTGLTAECSPGPYSLPTHIAQHVDFVSGIVGFPDVQTRPPVRRPNPYEPYPDAKTIDPDVIRTRYNATGIVCTNSNSSHAVAEFQAQYYSPSDLQQFWTTYVNFAPFRPVDKVIGTNKAGEPGLEASLDIQYIMGVAPNATTWFYSMAAFNFWTDLTTWAKNLNNETTLPFIHSISYGAQGDDPSKTYQNNLDLQFAKLGARGVSIVFASGDSGSGCGGGGYDGPDACACQFYPSFPATSPHVTSVGATRFITANSGPEGAVFEFKSGGGFSRGDFPLQSFQTTQVQAYFAQSIKFPPSCAYNASERGTPDVSALGDVYFQVIQGGQDVPVGGTSASSPTFSAIFTLLNDLRFNNGKSSLGYLNPLIYTIAAQNAGAFFDVIDGNNECPGCCGAGQLGGFLCSVGWDPVSGVGTPNYEELAKVVLTLP